MLKLVLWKLLEIADISATNSLTTDSICLIIAWNQPNSGCRTWQPFVGGKKGHENFRQARNYNFRDKCVIFVRNRKFANLIQKWPLYCPQGSGTLRQQLLMMHGIAWYCIVLHSTA